MTWTTRERAARESIGVGVSWTMDRVIDMFHEASIAVLVGMGDMYYVDATDGSDSNDGMTPEHPLLTMTAATGKCTAQHNDYIFVMEYHQPTGESFPIVLAKRSMHIIGVTSALEDKPHINPPSTTSAFNLNGASYGSSRIEIAGLGFCAGASSACIDINANCFGVKIHDCSFGHSYTGAQDGIEVNATYDAVELEIYDCIFGRMLTQDGIRIHTNATRCRIHHNFFHHVQGTAINVGIVSGITGAYICDNKFSCYADTDGEAITITHSASQEGFIDGNVANDDKASMTQQPFKDAGNCVWGVNWTFNVVDTPV